MSFTCNQNSAEYDLEITDDVTSGVTDDVICRHMMTWQVRPRAFFGTLSCLHCLTNYQNEVERAVL